MLSREATPLSRGAQDQLPAGAPRASRVASRLAGWRAPPWRTSSGSIGSSPPSRRIAGRPGGRAGRCLVVIPGGRSARGRCARHAECRLVRLRDGCRGIPRAGFRDFRSAPLSVEGSLRPIIPGPFIGSRALWSAGTRAHAPVALPRNARERSSSLKARALYIRSLCTPAPGDPGFVASPRPGSTARRARPGPSGGAVHRDTIGGTAPAGPRRAWVPSVDARARDRLEVGNVYLTTTRGRQGPRRARRRPLAGPRRAGEERSAGIQGSAGFRVIFSDATSRPPSLLALVALDG